MVGGTTHQSAPPPPSAPVTTPEEDEILKRNTDCVYFLASPLTCKKGSECEYRHSDVARMNPRDCWYWLNGNCLNPKCAFRHPPLDGLLGSDVSTPMGPPVPAPHATPYAVPKQGVACIFFQKGFCLKGHLCPFLHGPPNLVNNKASQSGPANPITEPPKMAPLVTAQKPIEFLYPQVKQAPLPARNGGNGAVDKKMVPPSNVEEPPRYKPSRVVPPPVMNEPPSNKPNRSYHHGYHVPETNRIVNGKDADEYSRELSPGFDVLVDNEVEDSEYSRDKDEFGRSRGHDYDVDRDMYREHRDYDHYNERDGHFDVDHVDHLERRPYPRSDRENESDLRHRISKQRRSSDNGMRSVVSREYSRENHADRMPRRDNHHHHRPDHRLDQGTLSSRLRGRIKIPGRSMSPTKENNSRVEREIDIERKHLSRYSPGRPLSLHLSRIRDRITGHRDMMSDNDSKFAGPKRLSELKSVPNDEQSLGKRKYPRIESLQSEDNLSFEGPKPLSEILKRKRGVDNDKDKDKHISSVNTEDNNLKKSVILSANKEEHNSVPADGTSVNYGTTEVEKEDGLIDEDALLDEELEAYDDNRDGDYEYEQMDGEEDYNMDEEGEYVDEEEEDGDEYGKKENVVYS